MTVVGVDVKTISLHGAGISTSLKAVLPDLIAGSPTLEWIAFGPSAALDQLPAGMARVPLELMDLFRGARLPFYDQVQLRSAVRREGVDVFYSPYFDAPVLLRIPTVVTMHDAVHLRFPKLYATAQRFYYQRLMRLHAARAAAVVTDSEFSKQELIALAGVAPERLRIVHNALPGAFRRPPDGPAPAALQRYHLPPEYVLYTGGVEERKNLRTLIRAYRAWRDQCQAVPPLVLTGAATRYEPYLADVHALDLQQAVIIPGRIADEDLPHVYAGATAVVYPSLYEGFGFPLLEAMAARVPVACSRRASLPEIGGDAAYYFDPESIPEIANALERVTRDGALREDLITRGDRRLCDFSIGATARALSAVLVEASGQ